MTKIEVQHRVAPIYLPCKRKFGACTQGGTQSVKFAPYNLTPNI